MLRPLTVHADARGSVRESYRASWFPDVPPIVQVVHSESGPGVLRGLHSHKQQHDIWHFTAGRAFVQLYEPVWDELDARWYGPGETLVIPPGVAHGFYTPEGCTLIYLLTSEWDGSDEFEFDALDPLYPGAAEWPSGPYVRSPRDLEAPPFLEWVGQSR